MTKPNFQEWFCLSDGRRNFSIDPVRDKEFLFGEKEWEEDINSRLKRAELLGVPVRLVWWGQFGIGKTHRLRHTDYLVKKNGYMYYPCYLVASDIDEKTGFDRLHYELVNSLNSQAMQAIVSAYILKLRTKTPGVTPLDELCRGNRDVEQALKNFGGDNQTMVLPAWRFLCGMTLKGVDLDRVETTKPALETSNDYSTAISALATIIKAETGKELLYLIDEGENLGRIQAKSAETRWREALRAILDLTNVNIVLTIGAEKQDGLPALVLQADIVRRFQRDNYVVMEAYKPPTARSFVTGLLGKWIDASRRAQLETAEKLDTQVPDYDPALYPFTTGSFEKFCEYVVIDPRSAKPSEIISRLNNIAAEAYLRDRRLITRDHLTDLGIA